MISKRIIYSRAFLFISLISLALLSSCTERIDIDVDSSSQRLVVEGSLTTDTMSHSIRLTKTGDYFSNQPAAGILGATVWVSSLEGDSIPFTETDTLPGVYRSQPDVFGVIGKTYTLHIRLAEEINGLSIYESLAETLPPVNPVDSIGLKFQKDWGPKGFWEIKVWAQDPPTREFYAFKAYLNNTLVTDSLDEIFISDDMFYNGNYTNGVTSQYLDLTKNDEILEVGDTVTFELNSISENYYLFIQEVQAEIFGNNPLFSGPPANVKGNISGNAMGFFAAYSISRNSKIATEDDWLEKLKPN